MISWLNFEELLIHNPIELINFSKSNIQVALSKKQYIDFFSNKAVYMGLYYDEEMDFCVMFYADPLQSSKSGEMYAEGYIDVDMKIYRVKVLSNVFIKYPPNSNFNLLRGTAKFDGFGTNSSNNSVSTITKTKISGIINTVMDVRTSGNAFAVGLYLYNAYSITAGQTVTISFMARGTNDTKVLVGFEGITNGIKEFRLSPNWELYTYTFTATTSGTHNFFMYGWDMVAGQWFQAYNPKAELGTTATPYMQSESESRPNKWNVTKTGMLVSPQAQQITMVQAGTLMRCEINNNITGWTDGTTQLNYSGQDFIIDGYGMRGLHNG